MLALAEQATVAAVAGTLKAGATIVGTRVELGHLALSPVGADLGVDPVLERSVGTVPVLVAALPDNSR